MTRFIDWLQHLHCPHHGGFCTGRACCCRDRHWKGLGFRD
jgi:hypothetical protein